MKTNNPRLVLVTGATGQQGGAVTDALLKQGHRVRAITRKPDSEAAGRLRERGAEVVQGDFTDHDSLVAAATGVDAIFAMTTPFEAGVDVETAQGVALTNAAKAAGVGHFIFSSVGDANRKTGIPHFDSKYAVEEAIAASGVNYTIMAPVYFMDNILMPFMAPSDEGVLSAALPAGRKLQQVAVADIGTFAAALVERRESVFGQRFDIAGDELTGDEVAAILTDAMSREITYNGFPADALRAQSEDLALMYEWFDAVGYSADIAALRRDFPEVGWHDYRSWANSRAWNVPETASL